MSGIVAAMFKRKPESSVLFWHRYFWRVIVPVLLGSIVVMSLGSAKWSAVAYSAWFVAMCPWVWAILTRRARLGGPETRPTIRDEGREAPSDFDRAVLKVLDATGLTPRIERLTRWLAARLSRP